MTGDVGQPVVPLDTRPPVTVSWCHVGDPAQTMLTSDGHRVWIGDEVPTVVPGAHVGDMYLCSVTGVLYRLD